MKCPACGSRYAAVRDSRTTAKTVRRRRRCEGDGGCGHRFTTYEVHADEIERELVMGVRVVTGMVDGNIVLTMEPDAGSSARPGAGGRRKR